MLLIIEQDVITPGPRWPSHQCGYPLSFRGHGLWGTESPPMFPGNGSLSRRLPSLFRVLMSPVPRSRRYYECATTSHPRINGHLLVRSRRPRDPPSFVSRLGAPGRAEVTSRPGLCLLPAALLRFPSRGREWDLSGLQAIHPVPSAAFQDPGRTDVSSPVTAMSVLPPYSGLRRPQRE